MTGMTPHENDQQAFWNGTAAEAWIDARDVIDEAFRPIEELLVEAVLDGPGNRVLDAGCGTGSTTLAVARRVGMTGRCTGIDISAPMVAVARARAAEESSPAEFVCADAESHAFAPAGLDSIVSRFGVMFFADPVRAFTNLRLAACRGGALTTIAWRSPAENPFVTAAERAAAPLLPDIPPRRTDGPGQFAWADDRKVRRILDEGGWSRIDIEPLDLTCSFPAAELDRYITRLGPVGRILREADEVTRTRVAETVRAAFELYVHGPQVRFTAACWLVRAQAL